MRSAILRHEKLADWVRELMQRYTVVGPVDQGGGTLFQRLGSPAELDLRYTTTILPPVRAFYPDGEVLFTFRRSHPEAVQNPTIETPIALFGVHACDLHGIHIMDEMMEQPPPDTHYLSRRETALIVGVDCQAPCTEHSFCEDKGTREVEPGLYDLFLTDLGDRYFVLAGSERGVKELTASAQVEEMRFTDRMDLRRREEEARPRFTRRIEGDVKHLPRLLRQGYDDLLWEVIGERCVSCGSCTLVCPTCICFDIEDQLEVDLDAGRRCRSWDSCQRAEFALVASGECFRPRAAERQRHRVFRKEVYAVDRYGRPACVGCGRCGAACTVGIDLVSIYNQILRA
jgi:ferredoxin